MADENLQWDEAQKTWTSQVLRVGKPYGYCVHKFFPYPISSPLKKIELFAFFDQGVASVIIKRLKELEQVKGGQYPPYLRQKGKYSHLFPPVVVFWNKSPVGVRCYRQSRSSPWKLEVTRGCMNGKGRKFLAPKPTLNSLGMLLRFLTENAPTAYGKTHDTFWFIDDFVNECKTMFLEHSLKGQLRDFGKQKLLKNIRFGFTVKAK